MVIARVSRFPKVRSTSSGASRAPYTRFVRHADEPVAGRDVSDCGDAAATIESPSTWRSRRTSWRAAESEDDHQVDDRDDHGKAADGHDVDEEPVGRGAVRG